MVVGGLLLKLTQLLNNLDNQCEMLTELSWICCLWLFVDGPPLLSFECCAQLILLTLTWDFAALLLSVGSSGGGGGYENRSMVVQPPSRNANDDDDKFYPRVQSVTSARGMK